MIFESTKEAEMSKSYWVASLYMLRRGHIQLWLWRIKKTVSKNSGQILHSLSSTRFYTDISHRSNFLRREVVFETGSSASLEFPM